MRLALGILHSSHKESTRRERHLPKVTREKPSTQVGAVGISFPNLLKMKEEKAAREAIFSRSFLFPIGTIERRQNEVGRQSSLINPGGARERTGAVTFPVRLHEHCLGSVTNSYEQDEATRSRQLQLYNSP